MTGLQAGLWNTPARKSCLRLVSLCPRIKKLCMKILGITLLVIGFALSAQAQEEQGWNFSGRFSGSSSRSGVVLKADPSLGYKFSDHVRMYTGLPVYFVNPSSTTTINTTSGGFINGIGNAYAGLR